jgi:hypothetical protein
VAAAGAIKPRLTQSWSNGLLHIAS